MKGVQCFGPILGRHQVRKIKRRPKLSLWDTTKTLHDRVEATYKQNWFHQFKLYTDSNFNNKSVTISSL